MARQLKLYRGEYDLVIAYSPADCIALLREMAGNMGEDEERDWTAIDMDSVFEIEDEHGIRRKKTASEWIAQEGRCYLGTEG